MYREPETVDIPVASPYYDRLRALSMQLQEVPAGAPERHFLRRQIGELTMRARRRMLMDGRTNI